MMRMSRLFSFSVAACLFFTVNVSAQQQTVQTLYGHVRPVVSSGQATLVGPVPADQTLNVTFMLSLRNQGELNTLLEQLYDPTSPNFHQYLSVEQFTEQFAPTAEDYQAVVDFAAAHGLTVTDKPANRLIVPVSGTAAQIESALHINLNFYQDPTGNRTFYSTDREPSVELSVSISHIAGLDNYSIPRPQYRKRAGGQAALSNSAGSVPAGLLLGSNRRTAYYGGTSLTGAGQAVGLFELDGYDVSDVQAYFNNVGQQLSVPVNNVTLLGASTGSDGDDTEQVIDIIEAASVAPGLSQILVYIAPGSNFAVGTGDVAIFNRMATDNIAKQISVSWAWNSADTSSDDPIFQEMAAQGQGIFIASGDEDAWITGDYIYPAEDAYVTAVGGTNLQLNNGAWASEIAWGDGNTFCSPGTGSGGGISLDSIGIPTYQLTPGVITGANGGSTTVRNAPDVAAEANCDNYYCANGACSASSNDALGGTSLAAPTWAGYIALANQQSASAGKSSMGFLNPILYQIGVGPQSSTDFHDITSGDNGLYFAVAGYDLVTGWGSPNGQNLINNLTAAGFTLSSSLTSGSLSVKPGSSVTTTITVNDRGGFSGSVALTASGLPSGVTASFSPTSTTGTSVLKLTASSSAPYAMADVVVSGSSGSLSASTTVPLTVLGTGFSLSASTGSQWVNPGSSNTVTITVNDQGGFTGAVNLSASGLPSGVTASFNPVSTTGTSVLTLTASSNAPLGSASVVVKGTSGSLSASANLSLSVVNQAFTVTASTRSFSVGPSNTPTLDLYVNPLGGFSGTVNLTVTGVPSGINFDIYSSSLNVTYPNRTGTVVIVVQTNSPATPTPGQYTVKVTGTSGSLSASTTMEMTVLVPTVTTLSISPSGGTLVSGTPYTLTATVTATSGSATPTGNVQFNIGSTPYMVPLNSSGVATYSSIAPAPGTLSLNATYLTIAVFGYSYADLTETVVSALTIGINSGGPAVSPFVADEDFTGGGTLSHANTIDTSKVTNPAPAAVYQTGRDGNFTYTIGGFTAGTNYLVRLHFCETYFTAAGKRTFNVSINNTQVLTDFDIFATAGGQNIANIQQFTEPANSSGQFVIVFTSVVNNSLVSGIEIDSTSGGSCSAAPTAPSGLGATATSSSQINLSWTASTAGTGCSITYDVFRSTTSGFTPSSSNQIASSVTATAYSDTGLAASTTYYYLVEAADSAGTSAASNQANATTGASSGSCTSICIDSGSTTTVTPFVADEDFAGGATLDHANTIDTSKVTNPAPAAVYQTGRDGNFTYTIPGFTANSSHTVRLHFCETYFTASGKRTFNVSINSTQVLTDFDIYATAGGQNIANIQQFTENANSSGQFVITFTSVVNQSLISGIEID